MRTKTDTEEFTTIRITSATKQRIKQLKRTLKDSRGWDLKSADEVINRLINLNEQTAHTKPNGDRGEDSEGGPP